MKLRLFALLAFLCLTVLTTSGGAAAVGDTSTGTSGEAAPADEVEIEALVAATGLTSAEAERLIYLTPHVHALEKRARQDSAFAGLWRDISAGGRVRIQFVDRAAERAAAVMGDFPEPDFVDAVTADFPVADLDALSRRILSDRATLVASGVRVNRVAVDPITNTVFVGVADVDTAKPVLTARYGAERMSVERSPAQEQPVCNVQDCMLATAGDDDSAALGGCTSRNSCTPYRAGLNLVDLDIEYSCSSAFSARDTNGWHGVLTAGHCFNLNEAITHDSMTFGQVDADMYKGSVDGAFIEFSLNARPPIGPGGVPSIYRNASSTSFGVTSVRNAAGAYAVGDPVCNSGKTRGYRCGTIKFASSSFFVGLTRFTDLATSNICTLLGDSGGPVFSNHQAQGIINFSNFKRDAQNKPICNSSPETDFSKTFYIQRDLA